MAIKLVHYKRHKSFSFGNWFNLQNTGKLNSINKSYKKICGNHTKKNYRIVYSKSNLKLLKTGFDIGQVLRYWIRSAFEIDLSALEDYH